MSIFIAEPEIFHHRVTEISYFCSPFFYVLQLDVAFLLLSAARSDRAFLRAVACVSACARGLRFSDTPRRKESHDACCPCPQSAAALHRRQTEHLQPCQARNPRQKLRSRSSR